MRRRRTFWAAFAALIFLFSARAWAAGSNGTTLQAYKTLDICDMGDGTWRYSGVVSIWNEGSLATQGLAILDCVQNKTSGPTFTNQYCALLTSGGATSIPPGTTFGTATTFNYSFVAAPLPGTIRNDAKVTITNHSGHLGSPFGPEPKATWTGGTPGPCPEECGCALGFGFWKTHNNTVCDSDPTSPLCVVWPGGYDPDAAFFLSGQTWLQALNTNAAGGNGYYQLQHQYIAAMLDLATGACAPEGVQNTFDLAAAWLIANTPGACGTGGSCGQQKDWAAALGLYTSGGYPGGPSHCASE